MSTYFESSSSASASQPSCDPSQPFFCPAGDPSTASTDLVSEGLISLSTAARLCPRQRLGRKVHTSTLYRWATTGTRGIQLEVLDTPGGLCTSAPAIQRFFAKLTAARNLPRQQPRQPRGKENHEAVEAELKRRFGI